MKGDYISRQAAQMEFANEGSVFTYGRKVCRAIIGRLDQVPAADVRENVRGKWHGTVCTACGESTSFYYDCDFCPNCGKVRDGDL